MYTIRIESRFSATHRVKLPDGMLEPLHGHDWIVQVWFAADQLNAHGMVIDFHEAKTHLDSVLAGLNHTDLNENDCLRGITPTAEGVAQFVFDAICRRGVSQIRRVEVTEAPDCVAAYQPLLKPSPKLKDKRIL